jgi:hypothetical protein
MPSTEILATSLYLIDSSYVFAPILNQPRLNLRPSQINSIV